MKAGVSHSLTYKGIFDMFFKKHKDIRKKKLYYYTVYIYNYIFFIVQVHKYITKQRFLIKKIHFIFLYENDNNEHAYYVH